MRHIFLALVIMPTMTFASFAQGATISDLVGQWKLTEKTCTSVVDEPSSADPDPFLPMPSRLILKFTRQTLTIDATYFGCVYRLHGPYQLSGDQVRLQTDRAINQCNGDVIDVPVEPFKVEVRGRNLQVSGLLQSARLCPPGQQPVFSFKKL